MTGETEQRAATLAQAAAYADQAAVLTRKAAALTTPATVVKVETPGEAGPPSPETERGWALKQIKLEGVLIRPGAPGSRPQVDMVFIHDGQARVLEKVTPPRAAETVTPDNDEVMEYRWQWRRRKTDNILLVQRYGLRTCLDRNWISEHEAMVHDLEQVPPGPPELPGIAF